MSATNGNTDRYAVSAIVDETTGQPAIEIVDRLAMQRIELDIPLALKIAGGINQMAALVLEQMQRQALAKPTLVVPRGPGMTPI